MCISVYVCVICNLTFYTEDNDPAVHLCNAYSVIHLQIRRMYGNCTGCPFYLIIGFYFSGLGPKVIIWDYLFCVFSYMVLIFFFLFTSSLSLKCFRTDCGERTDVQILVHHVMVLTSIETSVTSGIRVCI